MTAHYIQDRDGQWKNSEDVIEISDEQEAARIASLTDGRNVFDVARDVMAQQGYGFCEGAIVDTFTASLLTQIEDALSPENREKLRAMPMLRAVDVCWKLAAK